MNELVALLSGIVAGMCIGFALALEAAIRDVKRWEKERTRDQ